MRYRPRFSLVVFIAVMLFFYLPLMMLVVYSFNAGRAQQWTGFSLTWYRQLVWESRDLWRAVANSLVIAGGSAAVAVVFGTLGAIGLRWYSFRGKRYLYLASLLPLILPEIIVGVSLLVFFAACRLPLGLGTIFIAHTAFNLPFTLLVVLSRLEEFDYTIIEAARDLGARERDTLWRVIIPLSRPAMAAGFLTAVTLSLEDFVITFFVAGPGSTTLPLYVYSMIRFGVSPVINALSVVMIGATVVLAWGTRPLFK